MLTSSANQYLRPEYLTPLPTTLGGGGLRQAAAAARRAARRGGRLGRAVPGAGCAQCEHAGKAAAAAAAASGCVERPCEPSAGATAAGRGRIVLVY
ncbi:Protein of unknown function [Gryllus bimaculatus]|nr:Protein of unknown function [Gryllus bimaculatus]